MDELIDLAMAGHIAAFVRRPRDAAARHERPTDRFWAAVAECLDIFAALPSAALLKFDYWVDATRKNRCEPVCGDLAGAGT
jgi:hypothetical protein